MKEEWDSIKPINIILRWLIEENPIIFRIENIVIPLKAAINEFNKQNRIIIFFWIICIKIIIGIIFWIVIKINAVSHIIPSMVAIIQKWNGNIPNFINIDKNKIRDFIVFIFSKFKEIARSINLEEIPWIKKYNIVDFSLKNFWFIEIMGIIENKLISILIHIIKNEFDEKQIKILLIKDAKKIYFWIKNSFFISQLFTFCE